MRLLLDTHIWLWSLLEPERLAPRIATALTSSANELWLSPISVWETLMLVRCGRVEVQGNPGEWIAQRLSDAPTREASLTHEVAVRSALLAFRHRDPADRFLIASALVHDLTLVTADRLLLRSKACPMLPNRA